MTRRNALLIALGGCAVGALIGGGIGLALGVLSMPPTNFEGRQGYHASLVVVPMLTSGVLAGGFAGLALSSLIALGSVSLPEKSKAKDSFLLPALDEIRSIRVKNWRPDPQQAEAAFVVPEACWEAFLSVLADAQRDPHPYKWELLAELEIRTADGQSIRVSLCNLPDYPLGAFFASAPGRVLNCYRGGNTALFQQILVAARTESRQAEGA